MITQLTPEQEALIPYYREKWRQIALSTEPINREKAAEAVQSVYLLINNKVPDILFFNSPYAAWGEGENLLTWNPKELSRRLDSQLKSQLGKQLDSQVENYLKSKLIHLIQLYQITIGLSQANSQLARKLDRELDAFEEYEDDRIMYNIGNINPFELWSEDNCIQPNIWAVDASLFDFCISILNCPHEPKVWKAFQSLVKYCGWIYPYEDICYICDRPTKLSFDNQNRLHAEGEPAIQFADGYSLYSYHGVTLPEKYGKQHPHQWKTQWLLEEKNAEMRRVLIQSIGYERICQELQATELDNWQDYTLLKIDERVDVEPIYLLKMTCPSTGYIHALRVPPEMQTAREAIRWMNWGIDPEKFAVQT